MAHSAGPWNISPFAPGAVVCADGTPVAYAAMADAPANLRLIAAAPDLLAVCKRALVYIAADVMDEESEGREGAALALRDLLVAAIAKDEGK